MSLPKAVWCIWFKVLFSINISVPVQWDERENVKAASWLLYVYMCIVNELVLKSLFSSGNVYSVCYTSQTMIAATQSTACNYYKTNVPALIQTTGNTKVILIKGEVKLIIWLWAYCHEATERSIPSLPRFPCPRHIPLPLNSIYLIQIGMTLGHIYVSAGKGKLNVN